MCKIGTKMNKTTILSFSENAKKWKIPQTFPCTGIAPCFPPFAYFPALTTTLTLTWACSPADQPNQWPRVFFTIRSLLPDQSKEQFTWVIFPRSEFYEGLLISSLDLGPGSLVDCFWSMVSFLTKCSNYKIWRWVSFPSVKPGNQWPSWIPLAGPIFWSKVLYLTKGQMYKWACEQDSHQSINQTWQLVVLLNLPGKARAHFWCRPRTTL